MIAIRILFGIFSYIKTTNNYFHFNYRTCAVLKTGLQIIYLIFGVVLYIWIHTRHDKFNKMTDKNIFITNEKWN